MSVAATISERCASTLSTPTAVSACPTDHANPDEVDASALKRNPCSQRAEPMSQGLGMTKQPDACSSRNARRLSTTDGRGIAFLPALSPDFAAFAAAVTMQFLDGCHERTCSHRKAARRAGVRTIDVDLLRRQGD